MVKKVDLENFEVKLDKALSSDIYIRLLETLKNKNKIILLGNGGNLSVCEHGAADLREYVKNKNFISPTSLTQMTAYLSSGDSSEIYCKWLSDTIRGYNFEDCLLICVTTTGMNSSIRKAQELAERLQIESFTLSAMPCETKNNISFGVKYYHTAELLTLALFYDIAARESDLKKIN